MSEWRGIEELHLAPSRSNGLPVVPTRLLEKIRKHGPIEPVIVRQVAERRYEILSNAETWLAVQRLGQHRVPVEVLPGVDDEEAAEIVEASSGGDARDPLAEATALAAQLRELGEGSGWGATRRLAAITGLSRSYISHAVRLLRLPSDVQQLLREGRISVGHAKLLVTIPDGREQRSLALQIVAQRLSVRATEDRARTVRTGVRPAAVEAQPEPDADLLRLERALAEALGCAARICTGEGKLVVDYGGDLDILDGVLQRLGVWDF